MDNLYDNVIVKERIKDISDLIKEFYAEDNMENIKTLFWQIEGLLDQIDKYLNFVNS